MLHDFHLFSLLRKLIPLNSKFIRRLHASWSIPHEKNALSLRWLRLSLENLHSNLKTYFVMVWIGRHVGLSMVGGRLFFKLPQILLGSAWLTYSCRFCKEVYQAPIFALSFYQFTAALEVCNIHVITGLLLF